MRDMAIMATTSTEVKVTSSGQISLPAPMRRRWQVDMLLVVDRGDYAIVRPIPTDPVAALRGVYAGHGPSAEEARAAERATDVPRPRPGRTE